jgi:single stranded DNA-binding protein
MEKIVGYAVANAEVKNFDSGKSVVNFTIAENRYYKDNAGKIQQVTRFFECAYWTKNTKAADSIVKGKPVEVEGTIGVRAYIKDESKKSRKAVGVLTLKVRELILLGSKSNGAAEEHSSETVSDEAPF